LALHAGLRAARRAPALLADGQQRPRGVVRPSRPTFPGILRSGAKFLLRPLLVFLIGEPESRRSAGSSMQQ
jgi:hypothetical protein